jgi:hypothetical protein
MVSIICARESIMGSEVEGEFDEETCHQEEDGGPDPGGDIRRHLHVHAAVQLPPVVDLQCPHGAEHGREHPAELHHGVEHVAAQLLGDAGELQEDGWEGGARHLRSFSRS